MPDAHWLFLPGESVRRKRSILTVFLSLDAVYLNLAVQNQCFPATCFFGIKNRRVKVFYLTVIQTIFAFRFGDCLTGSVGV